MTEYGECNQERNPYMFSFMLSKKERKSFVFCLLSFR